MNVLDDTVGMNTGILPLQLLNVDYHDDYGYHTEIPKDSADAVCAYLGDMCVFCERTGNTGIPCAEENSVILFGKRNPFRLQEELEAELVPKVVIDVSHWRYGNAYSDVVDTVLRLGDVHKSKPDYPQMGITDEHIPELVEAVGDLELFDSLEGSAYYWGYVHALLALDSFPRVPDGAAFALAKQLGRMDDEEDVWMSEVVPQILGKVGERVIPSLVASIALVNAHDRLAGVDGNGIPIPLDDDDRDDREISYARITAFGTIKHIGVNHPESRDRCIAELVTGLMRYRQQDATTNAFIMSDLMDLKATGAMGIIEDAFKADCIDETVTGDIEDVRIALGLQTGRTMPAKRYHHFSSLTPSQREEPKTGRNDPCPCGSGKKHKKCCGK